MEKHKIVLKKFSKWGWVLVFKKIMAAFSGRERAAPAESAPDEEVGPGAITGTPRAIATGANELRVENSWPSESGLQLEKTPKVSTARQIVLDNSDDDDSVEEFDEIVAQATGFLESHGWCSEVLESRIGIFVPGIVSVFLFRIDRADDFEDEWLWVVVGDLPPGYLVTDYAPNAALALCTYMSLVNEWTAAVRAGESVEELYPINVPPTVEWAEQLETRMKFLGHEVLKDYKDDIKSAL